MSTEETRRIYLAIDLKSYYASVECVARGLNPLCTHLVVADASRTEKTICLAVSPSLKAYGISGRPRLFEVIEQVRKINDMRKRQQGGRPLRGRSADARELARFPEKALDFWVAPPRMASYIQQSAKIYQIYLRYVAPEDIHVYSIDEVFMDITGYLRAARMTPHQFARKIVKDVLKETGITATVGLGENLYLAKVAMDILAKRLPADQDGVRIAALTEEKYRQQLWDHRPLTDFWRVGRGYARRLEERGLFTMGDIARCSVGRPEEYYNEELLYRLFGVSAELLIDHAWGWEPCTMAAINSYRPKSNSLGTGQVLQEPYETAQARLVVLEMADAVTLDMVRKGLVGRYMTLTVEYDRMNLVDPVRWIAYQGEVKQDGYGRLIPKHSHGTIHFGSATASSQKLLAAAGMLFDRIVHPGLLVRRLTVTVEEVTMAGEQAYEQMDLSSLLEGPENRRQEEREQALQHVIVSIQKKYGKNALLRAMDLEAGATARQRNGQIGGHRA